MPDESILTAMASIPLFHGLAAGDMHRIASDVRRIRAGTDTPVMMLEQPGESVYVVMSGTVRVQAEQANGRLVVLAFLGAGDTVGEMAPLDQTGRSATVVTVEPCTFLWLDRTTFTAYLETVPRLTLNLVRILSRRLRLANERIQSLATLDVQGRVASQLTALATAYGEPTPDGAILIPLRMTQDDLADIIGASRERVNHFFVVFRRRGWISYDRSFRTTVRDMAALERLYR
jgi:CRP/FNR family cyclic AMP-dependent transcriptional regulator